MEATQDEKTLNRVVVIGEVCGKTNRQIRKRKRNTANLSKRFYKSVSNMGYICIALAYGITEGVNAGFEKTMTTTLAMYRTKFKKREVSNGA